MFHIHLNEKTCKTVKVIQSQGKNYFSISFILLVIFRRVNMLSYTFYMSETCGRLCSVSHSQLSSSVTVVGMRWSQCVMNVVTVPITLDYLQKSQEFSSSSEV